MSKIDAMRAMREARYAERNGHAARPSEAPRGRARMVSPPAAAPPDDSAPAEQLCGHRSISGRTCTREHGHAAKSHRYS